MVWLKRKASRYTEQYPFDRPEQRIPPSVTSVVSLYPLLFSICDHFSLLIVRDSKKSDLKKVSASTLYRYTFAIVPSGRARAPDRMGLLRGNESRERWLRLFFSRIIFFWAVYIR